MAKPQWGSKHICHSCGTRFYDLLRDPIVCPNCGAEFDPEALLKTRRSRAVSSEREEPVKRAKVRAPEADIELFVQGKIDAFSKARAPAG